MPLPPEAEQRRQELIEAAKRTESVRQKLGQDSTLLSALLGATDVASFGVAPGLQQMLFGDRGIQAKENLAQQHPIANVAGRVAGTIGPAVAMGPAGGILPTAGKIGALSAAQELGQVASEGTTGELPSLGEAAQRVGTAGALGAIGGATTRAVGSVLRGAASKLGDSRLPELIQQYGKKLGGAAGAGTLATLGGLAYTNPEAAVKFGLTAGATGLTGLALSKPQVAQGISRVLQKMGTFTQRGPEEIGALLGGIPREVAKTNERVETGEIAEKSRKLDHVRDVYKSAYRKKAIEQLRQKMGDMIDPGLVDQMAQHLMHQGLNKLAQENPKGFRRLTEVLSR